MRYVGQGHEVAVMLPDGVLSAEHLSRVSKLFNDAYRALYGREGPDVPLEVINWRVVASGPRPELNLKLPTNRRREGNARRGFRRAYFPESGEYIETAVYDRYALDVGMEFIGPGIVEERESTLIVGARGKARVDERLNIVVELNHE